MATRSRIAIETTDDSGNKVIKSIYCHFDGYASGVGKTLMDNYQDREKVESLISLGDISFLMEEITPTGPHSFNYPQKGVTVAYHRDRGEKFKSPRINSSVREFFLSDIEEYGYLFTEEGEWLFKSCTTARSQDPMTLESHFSLQ
jgi:hypothetical protein